MKPYMKPYKPHRAGEERRRGISTLIEAVVALEGDTHLLRYKKKLLDTLIWAYTEADGKWNTKFRSAEALAMTTVKDLRHDHVFTREQLRKELMHSRPEDVGQVLANAIACVVTKDEHSLLSKRDKRLQGWQRYDDAGVKYRS